ncbi:MAG: hypothetical protein VW520_04525, partial [Candidatus Puniceispirillum sp.]
RTAARESLPKCFQLFQTAPGIPAGAVIPAIVPVFTTTEAGYKPAVAGCLPLKFIFFDFIFRPRKTCLAVSALLPR